MYRKRWSRVLKDRRSRRRRSSPLRAKISVTICAVVRTEAVAKHAFQVGLSLRNNTVALDICSVIGQLITCTAMVQVCYPTMSWYNLYF